MLVKTLRGTVRGNTIEPEAETGLPEGTQVVVDLQTERERILQTIEQLAREGFIRPASDRSQFSHFTPLIILGKPLSETILEERG